MVRSQLPSPMNSSWFAAVFHLLSESICSEGQQLHQFYLELFLLNISQRRFLNCYKVTELGCIKHILPKLERERERERDISPFTIRVVFIVTMQLCYLGEKALPEIKENTFIGKRGESIMFVLPKFIM